MGIIDYPETSETNYQSTLHNIPEEQGSQNNEIVDCTANKTK
jgi:hypothetical protein